MFPARFTLVGDDGVEVSVELHADGTWSGDGPGFLEAASQAESDSDPTESLLLWLVIRAIRGAVA